MHRYGRQALLSTLCCVFALLVSSTLFAEIQQVRILHMNDFHGYARGYKALGSEQSSGGIACLAFMADNLRKEKPTLFLAAGDMIQGNSWANLFKGKSAIEVMNLMGFDAMVVGNHEFDYGSDELRERISEARFPMLGANVEGFGAIKPYVIQGVGTVKVAIIGLVTDETPVTTHPRNVRGMMFQDPVNTARRYVGELRDKVDLIILLTHLGHDVDRRIAREVLGIDVIVGGHTHTKVEKDVFLGKTMVVQAWEHGKALGVVDITLENGRVTGMEARLEEAWPITPLCKDHPVAALVEKYEKDIRDAMNEVVGETRVDLDRSNVKTGETNLGNLITDVMRQETGAQVAVTNGGGIRASIRKGLIRVNDIYSVLPFDNYIVTIQLTGRELKEALEHAVSNVEEEAERFLQVSGMSFSYDRRLPKGKRITEISVNGRSLETDGMYRVATNDFLAAGGDGYAIFRTGAGRTGDGKPAPGGSVEKKGYPPRSGRLLREAVIDSIKTMKTISPGIEGRIKEIR